MTFGDRILEQGYFHDGSGVGLSEDLPYAAEWPRLEFSQAILGHNNNNVTVRFFDVSGAIAGS
jgi:hypothetical protein